MSCAQTFKGCPYHQGFGNGDPHIAVTPEWFWLGQLEESNVGSLLKTGHSVWCRRISLYWHQTYTVHYAVIWSTLEPFSVLNEKPLKSYSLDVGYKMWEGKRSYIMYWKNVKKKKERKNRKRIPTGIRMRDVEWRASRKLLLLHKKRMNHRFISILSKGQVEFAHA